MHNTILQVMMLTYRIPLGIGIAVNVLVGNMLGAGKAHVAKRIAWLAMVAELCAASAYGVGMIAFRHQIPKVWSV